MKSKKVVKFYLHRQNFIADEMVFYLKWMKSIKNYYQNKMAKN